jgi:hypothetical protein
MSPLCESYVSAEHLNEMEAFYPLHVYVCEKCFLVQLDEFVSPQHIFSEYAYFSSYADSWVAHARRYAELMIERFGLTSASHVVEVASNDGYLLQHFVAKGIPSLGIEPAANVAKVAESKGVPTIVEFFGVKLAEKLAAEGMQADVIAANNVLAQVPDLNDFVGGLKILLRQGGALTIEFRSTRSITNTSRIFRSSRHREFWLRTDCVYLTSTRFRRTAVRCDCIAATTIMRTSRRLQPPLNCINGKLPPGSLRSTATGISRSK